MSALRTIAAVTAAVGLALVLLPLGPGRPRARLCGIALTISAWAVLAGTLVGSSEWRSLGTSLENPGRAAAIAFAALVALALVALAARVVARRPWVWFLGVALALPARVPLDFGKDASGKLLLPLYLVIIVGLAAWVFARYTGRVSVDDEPVALPIAVPLAAFVGFSLISMLWAHDSKEAAVKAVFFYIPFVILFLLVIAWWPRTRALETLAWTTAVGGAGVAVLAIAQYATRDIFWNVRQQQANVYGRFFRVNAIFFDPNILGRFLVIGILGAVAYAFWRPTPRVLVGMGLLAGLQFAGMFVTFSRSSCLQLVVGLGLITARAFRPRRVILVTVAVALVGGLAAASVSANVRRVVTDSDYRTKISEGRFALVEGGLRIWKDRPVLGVGLGGFEQSYAERLTRSERRKTRVVISHNTPVTVLSELGVVGFGLFLLLLGWCGVILRRRSRDGPSGWAAWTAAAMLAGIFVHSVFYAGFFEDPYVWVIAAGAFALVSSQGTRRTWGLGGRAAD